MKRIKHILLASVLLLVGLFAATGCDEKEIKLDFLNDVTEITYSIYPFDDTRTHVTDKEDITLLSSFFYESAYKKITEEDLNEDISKTIIIEVTSEENLYNISVYPDGKVSAIINGAGYISTSSAANYDGLLNKAEELRAEYEQYENTYFLRDVKEIRFLMNAYDSSFTFVEDKENLAKIISFLSEASYRERLYTDETYVFSNSLCIEIYKGDTSTSINVYPEGFATIQVNETGESFISDESINYDGLYKLLSELQENYRQNKNA